MGCWPAMLLECSCGIYYTYHILDSYSANSAAWIACCPHFNDLFGWCCVLGLCNYWMLLNCGTEQWPKYNWLGNVKGMESLVFICPPLYNKIRYEKKHLYKSQMNLYMHGYSQSIYVPLWYLNKIEGSQIAELYKLKLFVEVHSWFLHAITNQQKICETL